MEAKDIPSIFKLATKLTFEKKIQWAKLDNNSYSVDFSNSSIMVFKASKGANIITGFKLLNMRGEPVASIDTEDDVEAQFKQDIRDLYKKVRDNYILKDETYDDIFSNLKNLDKK
jgi:hypothetical protein